MKIALVLATFATLVAPLANANNYQLARDTLQSLEVVDDLVRRAPSFAQIHRTILQTYTIDELSKRQALRCNKHLAIVASNLADLKTRQDIAADCPTLNQVLLQAGF